MTPECARLALPPPAAADSTQWLLIGRLVQEGYEVVAQGVKGEVMLSRGANYRTSGWDQALTLLTCGLWLIVIAIKAATGHRQVVTVSPEGAIQAEGGPVAPPWVVALGVLAVGAAGLAVATAFSPLVAGIAVPVGLAIIAHWPLNPIEDG